MCASFIDVRNRDAQRDRVCPPFKIGISSISTVGPIVHSNGLRSLKHVLMLSREFMNPGIVNPSGRPLMNILSTSIITVWILWSAII
jgi:hypothetical protein